MFEFVEVCSFFDERLRSLHQRFEMVFYKLWDTFRRVRVATDNRASRDTLFVHFRQNEKPSGCRVSLYKIASSFFIVNKFQFSRFMRSVYLSMRFCMSVQWNPAITKCHGTEKIVRYSGVFVIAKTPL